MEKSLYSNLIEKSFPKLILAISEKLNDKNQPELDICSRLYFDKSILLMDAGLHLPDNIHVLPLTW